MSEEAGRVFFQRLWEHDQIVFDARSAAVSAAETVVCASPLAARTMQRKPTWLVDVSIGSAWRAAGR